MDLKNLNEELYKPHSKIGDHQHEKSEYDPETMAGRESGKEFTETKDWKGEKNKILRFFKLGRFFWLAAIAILVIMIGTASFVILGRVKKNNFDETKVRVDIDGSQNVNSNETEQYVIRVTNENNFKLENVEISLNYSHNFELEDQERIKVENPNNSQIEIGSIKPKESEEIGFSGKFYAPKESLVFIRATLNYVPSGFNAVFKSNHNLAVTVKSSPFDLDIIGPHEAADQSDVFYTVYYRNNGSRTFENLKIKAEYPEGFDYRGSEPAPQEGTDGWFIRPLAQGDGGEIRIQGTISGERGSYKNIQVTLGSIGGGGSFIPYSQNDKSTRIVTSPLSISQSVNKKTASSEDKLEYVVNFKNEGDIGLEDIILTVKIDSPLLDYRKLSIRSGAFDSANKTITWKASDLPVLALLGPGSSGSVTFSIELLDKDSFREFFDQNRTKEVEIVSLAQIDTPSIPIPAGANKVISSNQLGVKVESLTVFETKGFYHDPAIPNSGPIPPQIGQATTYTFHWIVSSANNDIKNGQVTATLPPYVTFTGEKFPEKEDLQFNSRTNQLTWNIDLIPAGSGVWLPAKEVIFQISLTPELPLLGKQAPLLNAPVFSGKDAFTDRDISLTNREKTTQLQEDTQMPYDHHKVIDPQ